MRLCYIDESGTPDIPGNTSHFVLAGLSIPDQYWKEQHRQVAAIKGKYDLAAAEVHVAWMLRPYVEQQNISGFEAMGYSERLAQMQRARATEILRLRRGKARHYKQTRKNYRQTEGYVHLTLTERQQAVKELAELIANWGEVRLFAECIDKLHFAPSRGNDTVAAQAFEQIVSRFEQYLQNIQSGYGLLVHDNNVTVAKRHTEMMQQFLQRGTLWTQVEHIIETPMFVDSQLTSMVQLADLCAYALRRYVENGEDELFDLVFQRADQVDARVVGVRHFTNPGCRCKICVAHR